MSARVSVCGYVLVQASAKRYVNVCVCERDGEPRAQASNHSAETWRGVRRGLCAEDRLFLAPAKVPRTTKSLPPAAGALPQSSPHPCQLLLPRLPSQHYVGGRPRSSWGGLCMPDLRLWGAGIQLSGSRQDLTPHPGHHGAQPWLTPSHLLKA